MDERPDPAPGLDLLELRQEEARLLGLPDYAAGKPEGFLFPATYNITSSTTATQLLTQMVNRYKQVANSIALVDGAKKLGLSPYQVVTIASLIEAEVKRLRTKTSSIRQLVVNLSGGNQQKVVLGKWLAMNPRLLILDEPTRGIDVGAKAEIYRHMAALAAEGITILMVSSDMEEIMGMSDRVVVMHERRIKGVLLRSELTQERIAKLMTGKTYEGERAA